MGENVLRIKAIAETGDVQATLDELGGNFTKLGKTAIEASAGSKQAWRDLGAAIAEAVPGCDSVAQAIERVATTSDKLGDAGASGNIKRMQSALEASGLAIMDLQAQYEKVTAVAPELGVEIQTAMTVAQAGFEAGKQKLAEMSAALQSVRDDIAGVGKGATDTSAALEQMGTAGASSAQTLTRAGGEAAAALAGIGPEGLAAAAALDKLALAGDSPRGLAKNAAVASVALNELKAAIEQAGAQGVEFGPQVAKAMTEASMAIEAAATRAAAFRFEMAQMKLSADASATGFVGLSKEVGSTNGLLKMMGAEMPTLGSGLMQAGFAAITAQLAFDLLKKGGEALGAVMAGLVDKQSKEDKASKDNANSSQLHSAAMAQVEKGAINLGGSLQELEQNYIREKVAVGLATAETAKFLEALKITTPPGLIDTEKKIEDIEAALHGASQKAIQDAEAWSKANAGFSSSSVEAERSIMAWVGANKAQLEWSLKAKEATGQDTTEIRGALDAYAKYTAAIQGATKSDAEFARIEADLQKGQQDELKTNSEIVSSVQKILDAEKNQARSTGDSITATADASRALQDLALKYHMTTDELLAFLRSQALSRDASQQEKDGLGQVTASLDQFSAALTSSAEKQRAWAAEAIANMERVDAAAAASAAKAKEAAEAQEAAAAKVRYTMEIIQTSMMQASDASVAALEKQIDAFKRLHDVMGDGAKNLEDYAANMKAAWESGTMSLTAFNEQIDIAIRQLDELVAKNAGTDFAKQTQQMADALRELQKSVNMGTDKQGPKLNI